MKLEKAAAAYKKAEAEKDEAIRRANAAPESALKVSLAGVPESFDLVGPYGHASAKIRVGSSGNWRLEFDEDFCIGQAETLKKFTEWLQELQGE